MMTIDNLSKNCKCVVSQSGQIIQCMFGELCHKLVQTVLVWFIKLSQLLLMGQFDSYCIFYMGCLTKDGNKPVPSSVIFNFKMM